LEVNMKKSHRLRIALLAMAMVGALSGCGESSFSGGTSPPNPGNVAVLVVDDFGFGKSGAVGGMDENCVVATNDVGSGGAGEDLPPSDYSHGELVYSVLKDELSRLNPGATPTATTTPRPSSSISPVDTSTDWTYKMDGKPYTVRLVAVHADKYRTEDVIAGISARMTSLHGGVGDGIKFDRFVLNLSFVVIPCNVPMWLDEVGLQGLLDSYKYLINKDQTLKNALNSYASGAIVDTGVARSDAFNAAVLRDDQLAQLRPFLVGAFYQQVERKGLHFKENPDLVRVHEDRHWSVFFSAPLGESHPDNAGIKVIPVGAAGNGVRYYDGTQELRRGLKFPFAPGLWDFVVSASADSDHTPSRLNSGEVKLAGTGPSTVQGSFGTSFAAPRLSALEAIYLLKTGLAQCAADQPPLGYVNAAVGATANGVTWDNLGSGDWPAKCPDFVQLTAPA
jgi:hypothetical protein